MGKLPSKKINKMKKIIILLSVTFGLMACSSDDDSTTSSSKPKSFTIEEVILKKVKNLSLEPDSSYSKFDMGVHLGGLNSDSDNFYDLLDTNIYTTGAKFKSELSYNFTSGNTFIATEPISPRTFMVYTKGALIDNRFESLFDFTFSLDSVYNNDNASTFEYVRKDIDKDSYEWIFKGQFNY